MVAAIHSNRIIMNTDQNRNRSQQGSGSAENRGGNRNDQKNPLTDIVHEERKWIAGEAGIEEQRVSDIRETGGLSGRDDSSGGSGDDMSRENTNDPTERII